MPSWRSLGQIYGGVDKSLARPGRKQATATEDFDVHINVKAGLKWSSKMARVKYVLMDNFLL
jgi:hypothetical protein